MKAWGLTPTQWERLPRGDQAIIIAHEANEAERCPSCGHRLNTHEKFAVIRHECAGCQQLDKAEKERKPGVFHTIRRIITPTTQ